jgi:hypothetical protein
VKDRQRGAEVARLRPAAKNVLLLAVCQDNFSKIKFLKQGNQNPLCPFIYFAERRELRQRPFRRED